MAGSNKNKHTMAPVFRYRWQMYLLFGFLGMLMVMPFLPKPDWMDRRILYRYKLSHDIEHYNMHDEIMLQKKIHILFIGTSRTGRGMDIYYLRDKFRERFGVEPSIYALFHKGQGWDLDYTYIKDILQRVQVDLIVFEMGPHMEEKKITTFIMPFYWDYYFHRDMLPPNWVDFRTVYLYSIFNNFKLLSSAFLPMMDNRGMPDPLCPYRYNICDEDKYASYARGLIHSPKPKIKASHILHKNLHVNNPFYEYVENYYGPQESYILSHIMELTKKNNTKMIFISFPSKDKPNKSVLYQIPPNIGADNIPIMSINIKEIFNRGHIRQYFYNIAHLGPKGSFLYTLNIAPVLMDYYEKHVPNITEVPSD